MSRKVKKKIIKTNIERYKTPYPMQNKEVLNKALDTMNKNGVVKTSSEQLKIYDKVVEMGYNAEINFKCSRLFLDIALFVNDVKINIECDGAYWHKESNQKDIRRDKFLQSDDWKVVRIRYDKKSRLPNDSELEHLINNAVNGRMFQCFDLT